MTTESKNTKQGYAYRLAADEAGDIGAIYDAVKDSVFRSKIFLDSIFDGISEDEHKIVQLIVMIEDELSSISAMLDACLSNTPAKVYRPDKA